MYEKLIDDLRAHNEDYGQGRSQNFFKVCLNCKEAADAIEDLQAQLVQVTKERDFAVKSWRGFCAKCAWDSRQHLSDGRYDDRCVTCRQNLKCNWEWRGPGKDEEK